MSRIKLSITVLLTVSCQFCLLYGEEKIKPVQRELNQELFGARIQRTMTLLETSSKVKKRKVKILFYGQSIVSNMRWKDIIAELRKRYPYAEIIAENRAIGGFTANCLYKTLVHDVITYYPDLVVFHVYEGDFNTSYWERIIYNIKKYTTAEIIVFTHQLSSWKTSVKSNDWNSKCIRYIAQKYNCELVEVRKEWKTYLKLHNISPNEFTGDGVHPNVHPNTKGNELLKVLIMRHFKFNTISPVGWYNMVKTYDPRKNLQEKYAPNEIELTGPWKTTRFGVVGNSSKCSLKLKFTGNRLDVVAMPFKDQGSAKILVDGKAPSSFTELYAVTRPSQAYKFYFPAIHRVQLGNKPICEKWTLKVKDILSFDAKRFTYELCGSETGFDGTGKSWEKFVSNSGRIVLLPEYMGIALAQRVSKKKCPPEFEISWEVKPMFIDVWKPENIIGNHYFDQFKNKDYTLVQGLTNTEHTLEIILNGDGNIPVKSIIVYRPPLH